MARRRKKKKRRITLLILEILLLLILAAGLFVFAQLSRMGHVNVKNLIVNNGITGAKGYRNFALFGVDSREGELASGTNSDTIIICSINRRTNDVKLVSVYTYLNDSTGTYRKATETYAAGGAERAISMLNMNLDLDITDFVTVDFNAIVELVDLMGGIDLDITEEELQWVNGYCVENQAVTGVSYTPLESAGYQHVNGIQALAYCRIRYTDGWDFKRTERQRTVLLKLFDKAREQGVASIGNLVKEMLPHISTSLSTTELISLAAGLNGYQLADNTGFPFDTAFADISAGDVVVPVTLSSNVAKLHSFLYGEEGYVPSQTVQDISNNIINATGIQ